MTHEFRDRILALDTATFCNANKQLRVVEPVIKPLFPGLKLLGVARTVRCNEDFLTLIKALSESRANEVLVVDCQGFTKAVVGELFSAEAKRRGLAGFVIDGSVRDTQIIKRLEFPVYCRSIHPMAGTTTTLIDIQIPVSCGGVMVNPGDIIFGDDDGLIVASSEEFTTLLSTAEAIQAKERHIFEQIQRGQSLFQMLNLESHLERLAQGEPSQLKMD
jgi:4-hydroxy-4-methyl-2-oxoglutarate aldolase